MEWKYRIASVLMLALIIISAVAIPWFLANDHEVSAVDIALDSPQMQEFFQVNSLKESRVTDITVIKPLAIVNEHQAMVVLYIDSDFLIVADVDMGTKELSQLFTLELNKEKKQEIIEIARGDSEIQSLLEQGASIGEFYPDFVFSQKDEIGPGGEIHSRATVDFVVQIKIELEGKEYMAIIDLETDEVIDLVITSG